MSKSSYVSRAFARVQEIISQYLSKKYNPTTREIQLAYYGNQYDSDSSSQYNTIYGCINRGRKLAIEKWDQYIGASKFWSDLEKSLVYMGDEIEDAAKSEEYKKYINSLIYDGVVTNELLEVLPAIELLFEQMMYQFSNGGTNFIISDGNPFKRDAKWYRPSRAGWNIREERLYRRTVKILDRQFKRGLKTQVKLTSGESLRKVLDFTRSMRASLEDSTSWRCNYCQARNLAEDSNCKICGHPRQ